MKKSRIFSLALALLVPWVAAAAPKQTDEDGCWMPDIGCVEAFTHFPEKYPDDMDITIRNNCGGDIAGKMCLETIPYQKNATWRSSCNGFGMTTDGVVETYRNMFLSSGEFTGRMSLEYIGVPTVPVEERLEDPHHRHQNDRICTQKYSFTPDPFATKNLPESLQWMPAAR